MKIFIGFVCGVVIVFAVYFIFGVGENGKKNTDGREDKLIERTLSENDIVAHRAEAIETGKEELKHDTQGDANQNNQARNDTVDSDDTEIVKTEKDQLGNVPITASSPFKYFFMKFESSSLADSFARNVTERSGVECHVVKRDMMDYRVFFEFANEDDVNKKVKKIEQSSHLKISQIE